MSFELIRKIYDERIPFHRFLGLRLVSAEQGRAQLEFEFRPQLIGNRRLGVLHGGVIATALDVIGSAAILSLFGPGDAPVGMGTIDMRVDYLRPARGKSFKASAEVIRDGRSIVVTRMELRNDQGELLSIATASYRIDRGKGETVRRRILTDWLEED